MGLLTECPRCKNRNSLKRNKCKCGYNIKKASSKIYWIEYYYNGCRKRERIGASKLAVDNRYREVQTAKAEERHIDKDPAITMTLKELTTWYLELSEVKAKKSYRRDTEYIRHLKRILQKETKIKNITSGMLENYQQQRLNEDTPRRKNQKIKPATINKEITCLKTIFNRAIRYDKLKKNPVNRVKKLVENNVRMQILNQREFEQLYDSCAYHLKPIVLTAYYTGMRKPEIMNLTWDKVDLKKGFIRLPEHMTKTKTKRSIPLHPKLINMFKNIPKGLHTNHIFLLKGKPINNIKTGFNNACKRAGIKIFTFHDLRHCSLNNMRLAGNDYFKIMAASGHKTTSVFKRYNLVTEEELSQMKWHDIDNVNRNDVDTYMYTINKKG